MKRLVLVFLLSLAVFAANQYDYFGRLLSSDDKLLVTIYDNQLKRYVFISLPEFQDRILRISPLDITGSLPNGTVGQLYSHSLIASGGVAPYKWEIESGALPTGLGLGPNGIISGMPSQFGTFTVTVKVTDSVGAVLRATFTSVPFLPRSGALGFK